MRNMDDDNNASIEIRRVGGRNAVGGRGERGGGGGYSDTGLHLGQLEMGYGGGGLGVIFTCIVLRSVRKQACLRVAVSLCLVLVW